MPLGDLDRRISLYTSTTAYNSFGEPTLTWALNGSVWAGIAYEVTPENFKSDQLIATQRMQFMIRYKSLTEKWKVVYGGKTYDILSIEEVGRKNYLLLNCESRDNIT